MNLAKRLAVVAAVGLVVITPPPAHAQYSANFQTNIISGVTSNWSGDYYIGSSNYADALLIQNSGTLYTSGNGFVGNSPAGSNNSVLVTGTGSVWQVFGQITEVGYNGSVNSSLVVSNGGSVISNLGSVGVAGVGGSNTSAVVTGPGSVWNSGTFGVGGPDDRLVIANGGRMNQVVGGAGGGCYPVGRGGSILVTGTGSVLNCTTFLWIGTPGYNTCGSGHSLVISNGGEAISLSGYVGVDTSNSALVTGAGSVWTNGLDIFVGDVGSDNSLVISDGATVFNGNIHSTTGAGYVGGDPNNPPSGAANGNRVVVTGTGSTWNDYGSLSVGYYGFGNSVVISNNSQVLCRSFVMGVTTGSSNNCARIVDGGLWQARTAFSVVGSQGSGNSLVIDGGSVVAPGIVIGAASSNCDNSIDLKNGNLIVTNAGHNAVLEVRKGTLILNGGLLQVDNLVITNSCASFSHTGGTLIAGSVVLDPNKFRITSVTRQGNDMGIGWMMGPGRTNALQETSGDANGGYNTNGFTDIFIVTNNATAGTVTNYLDAGAATNVPARYYRVRLIP